MIKNIFQYYFSDFLSPYFFSISSQTSFANIFAATGFFLDQDTYFNEQKVLRPGYNYQVEENKNFEQSFTRFADFNSSQDLSSTKIGSL